MGQEEETRAWVVARIPGTEEGTDKAMLVHIVICFSSSPMLSIPIG